MVEFLEDVGVCVVVVVFLYYFVNGNFCLRCYVFGCFVCCIVCGCEVSVVCDVFSCGGCVMCVMVVDIDW